MCKLLLGLVLVIFTTINSFAEQLDPKLLEQTLVIMRDQRNTALDAAAIQQAKVVKLQEELDKIKNKEAIKKDKSNIDKSK